VTPDQRRHHIRVQTRVEWMLNSLLKAKKVTSLRTKHSIACLDPLSQQVDRSRMETCTLVNQCLHPPQRTVQPAQPQQILQPPQAQPQEAEAQTWTNG
jgi:hypothetical protein